MEEEELAKQRIEYIAKRQELLATAVSKIQEKLFEEVLSQIDKIVKDPATLDSIFNNFTKTQHSKVVQQFAVDIMNIGKLNENYFKAVAANVDAKDYKSIKKSVDGYLLDRFGLNNAGGAVKDGFIDSFVKDPSLKRTLKEFAYKTQTSGGGLQEFKQGFKDLIVGNEQKVGALQRHYSTFAYDTYQQADAAVQDQYADKLGLTACLYLGGEISGTRPFCRERNGKVFLKDEIEDWKKISFAGKPANYNPFLDRGGYNCRHHLNYITDQMAVNRRSDLVIDENGRLAKKGAGTSAANVETVTKDPETGKLTDKPKNSFKPADSVEEAESRIKAAGVKEVVLAGLKKPQFNAIVEVIEREASIGKLKLDKLQTYRRNDLNAALYSPSNNAISLNLKNVAGKHEKQIVDSYEVQLQEYKDLVEKWQTEYLNKAGFNQRKVYSGINSFKNKIFSIEQKIKAGETARPWTLSGAADDGIEALRRTVTHELGHYRHYKTVGTDEYFPYQPINSVTEYGRTNREEFFAEWFTSYRTFGEQNVPEYMLKLFKKIENAK